jgi:hypothetical protein
VNDTGYKLLGWAVWRVGIWYIRRRLPSRRTVVLGLAAVGLGAGALALAASQGADE